MFQQSPEYIIHEILIKHNLSLAVAESCTGGLVSHRVTNVPGSSHYFLGGVVAYHNEVKILALGVHRETLEMNGAVSEATVREMAHGVRRMLKADIGLATSGIAGPGGGTLEKPVGLTWIGLSAHQYDQAWKFVLPGDRFAVKEQAAEKALILLVQYLFEMVDKS